MKVQTISMGNWTGNESRSHQVHRTSVIKHGFIIKSVKKFYSFPRAQVVSFMFS